MTTLHSTVARVTARIVERSRDSRRGYLELIAGGITALNAIAGPFGAVKFCPTGGITLETAPAWLALGNVLCVGGSWLVPKGAPDLATVEAAARAAAALRR